jgi:hypothetical protein
MAGFRGRAGRYSGIPIILNNMGTFDRFMREKPSGGLYHHTGPAGVIGIFQSRKLWATDY